MVKTLPAGGILDTAELAVWVDDAWQGHGVGTPLGRSTDESVPSAAADSTGWLRSSSRQPPSSPGVSDRRIAARSLAAMRGAAVAPASVPAWVASSWGVIVKWRRWIWLMLSLACLLLAVRAVTDGRAELLAGISVLRHASWICIGLAIVAECCSFTALAFAQRRMLRAGGVHVSVGALARLAVASQAVGSVLPAGYLVSGVVVLRVLARRGVRQLLALWMLAIAGLLYVVTLLLIGLIGTQLAHAGKNAPYLRLAGAIMLGTLTVAFTITMAVARLRKHPWTVHGLAARMPGGRLKRLIGGDVLANVSLGPKGWAASFLWTLLYWLGDITCLAIAFLAVGRALPWQGLLIAYAAGHLAALLPFAPGGLGLTEGGMIVALAAYGGTAGALAAVLLYRLITYWAVLPAGSICYLSLRRQHSVVTPARKARERR